jgi:hypothetical protein
VLKTLPEICVNAVKLFSETNKAYDARRGKQLFQIAVASYNAANDVSLVESFSVAMDEDGVIGAGNVKTQRFEADQDWSLVLFGEASYLEQQVLRGTGARFLSDKYGRFRNGPTRIRDTDPAQAVDFVYDLLAATAQTTTLVPSPTGIGGPIDIVLIGKPPHPQRIRWK